MENEQGGHHKQYTIWVEQGGGGMCRVKFHYGPIGGYERPGTKTKKLVGEYEAIKVYEQVITEKVNKGYLIVSHETAGKPIPLNPAVKVNLTDAVVGLNWGVKKEAKKAKKAKSAVEDAPRRNILK